MRPAMKYFNYDHLPPYLQVVSKQFYVLAWSLFYAAEEGEFEEEEISVALRKLLEAKDAAVRAAVSDKTIRYPEDS